MRGPEGGGVRADVPDLDQGRAGTRRAPRFQLQPDDLIMLGWLARIGYMTTPQLARALGRTRQVVQRRVSKMASADLLTARRVLVAAPRLLLPTARGIAAAELDLPVPRLSLGTLRHTLAVMDLAVTYHRMGHRVVAEREINEIDSRLRTVAQPDGSRVIDWSLPLTYAPHHPSGRQQPYIPDLAVVPDDPDSPFAPGGARSAQRVEADSAFTNAAGQFLPGLGTGRPSRWGELFPISRREGLPVAIEVEFTRKPVDHYAELLARYRDAPHLGGVIWFTDSTPVAHLLEAGARRARIPADRWRLELYVPWADARLTP